MSKDKYPCIILKTNGDYCVYYPSIIIWPCLKKTGNYQIQELDWLKSILTAV